VPAVLEKMPELIAKDFVEYFKDGSGRDAKDSGLFVYNEERKIHSMYTPDRSKKTTLKPVNCRQWNTKAYVDSSEANPAAFSIKCFRITKTICINEPAVTTSFVKFNLAETVIEMDSGNSTERAGRARLMREL
jgi:hypothetical protein